MSGLTISAPERHRWCLLLALPLLLAGCGPAHVIVQGDFPPPLIDPLPVKIGVWYDEPFSHHEFREEAKNPAESSWIVQTGAAQLQMWNTLLDGMFADLTLVSAKPASEQPSTGVDAVLIPHVEQLQYSIPAQTNVKVYEIWMRYRFELVSPEGESIAEWSMPAYGKTPTAFLQSDEAAVNLAAIMALRDAGANFATSFQRVPAIQDWLQQHQPAGSEATP